MPDCGASDPRIESHHQQLCVYRERLGTGCAPYDTLIDSAFRFRRDSKMTTRFRAEQIPGDIYYTTTLPAAGKLRQKIDTLVFLDFL